MRTTTATTRPRPLRPRCHGPLRRAALSVLALATLGGATALGTATASAASPCQADCVAPVAVTRTPFSASFSFTTTGATTAELTLYTKGWTFVEELQSTSPATSHAMAVTKAGLVPTDAYWWFLTVRDGSGAVRVESGEVRAMRRQVGVWFDAIEVTDDSDTFSAGDVSAHLRAGGVKEAFVIDDVQWPTGETRKPNRILWVQDAPVSLPVRVQLTDDDADPGEFCSNGLGPSWTTGSTSCADWATAAKDLPAWSPTPGWQTTTFAVTQGPIDFEVTARYFVEYL